jgi:hypothetical protein
LNNATYATSAAKSLSTFTDNTLWVGYGGTYVAVASKFAAVRAYGKVLTVAERTQLYEEFD